MTSQDPLKKPRLGLPGILLVSGGVLAAAVLLPVLAQVPNDTPTASLQAPATSVTASATRGTTGDTGTTESDGTNDPSGTDGTATRRPLLPVYWFGDVDGSEKLFREYLDATEGSSGDPIADALLQMTTGNPLDPNYSSPWRQASSVSSTISTRNVITVDISADAFGERLDEVRARLALQELVYTATAAASHAGLIAGGESSSVVVLVDGVAGYRAFGSVDLDGEWTRDSTALAPVWIIDPQEGAETEGGSLTVNGVGPAADGELSWRVDLAEEDPTEDSSSAEPVQQGTVGISADSTPPGAYSFSLSLPAGRYVVTVAMPSGDAEDTKTVVVR